MDRIKLLEAVADVARDVMQHWDANELDDIGGLRMAIRALDAHHPEPAGETVGVRAVVALRDDGRMLVDGIRGSDGEWRHGLPAGYNVIATITATVPLPTIPTIRAEVEPATLAAKVAL